MVKCRSNWSRLNGGPALVVGLVLSAALAVGACGPPESAPAGAGKPATVAPWFVDVTAASGVDFTHQAHLGEKLWSPASMGGGFAVFDADGDGDLDLYFTSGNERLPEGTQGEAASNRFFTQVAPFEFVDATDVSGLGDRGYGMGVAIGDIDNDGDPDVYVTNFGPDRLYRNRGDGTFEDVTAEAGLGADGWSVSAAFLDFDRDGLLDLYVTQYVEFDGDKRCTDAAGRPEFCGPLAFPPVQDILLRGNGGGTFSDVSQAITGAAAGLGVVCDDFDGDGWVDIYVANDAYANNLWINARDGSFSDEGLIQGAAFNLNGQAEAGMGVVAADLNADSWPDLFVTHLMLESNTYYRSLGSGRGFQDETGASRLAASSMNFTGFGTTAFDIELDGDLDLVVANGRVRRGPPSPGVALAEPWNAYAEPNLLYLNDGEGKFLPDSGEAHDFTAAIEVNRGLVSGDLDGDGDLDMVMTQIDGAVRLFRNDAPRVGSWLRVRAIDAEFKRDAIGARVVVQDGERVRVRTVTQAVGYATSGPADVHFGLTTAAKQLTVRWPGGDREEFAIPALDRALVVRRGAGKPLQ